MVLFISVIPEIVMRKHTSDNVNQVFLGQCLSRDRIGSVLLYISLD